MNSEKMLQQFKQSNSFRLSHITIREKYINLLGNIVHVVQSVKYSRRAL